jgi:hypothetical protein
MYRLTIMIEPDDFAGYHAIISDADHVLFITDSYFSPEDAKQAAGAWIDHNHRWPQSA